jgi:hypothetical protein
MMPIMMHDVCCCLLKGKVRIGERALDGDASRRQMSVDYSIRPKCNHKGELAQSATYIPAAPDITTNSHRLSVSSPLMPSAKLLLTPPQDQSRAFHLEMVRCKGRLIASFRQGNRHVGCGVEGFFVGS